MAKHIILMHGRAIKPAEAVLAELARKALEEGMRRIGRSGLVDAQGRSVKFSSAYFGDISNNILAKSDAKEKSKLTARDLDHNNAPCFPREPLDDAFDITSAFSKFNQATYHNVLGMASDWRFLDEAAETVSTLSALLTGGLFNTVLINLATKDLGAYLTSHDVGSAMRRRLDNLLQPRLLAGDDVCLVTHSMGCMVAYDVMWKYAHMSEYATFRKKQVPVAKWVTIGNPLGEIGVQRNLLDGRYAEDEKYPSHQIKEWANLHAEDDYISHVEKLAPVFKPTKKNGLPKIKDRKLYNCWVYRDIKKKDVMTSNPHDLYGYLMNQVTAQEVADWIDLT